MIFPRRRSYHSMISRLRAIERNIGSTRGNGFWIRQERPDRPAKEIWHQWGATRNEGAIIMAECGLPMSSQQFRFSREHPWGRPICPACLLRYQARIGGG
jgi:hypothetical protein